MINANELRLGNYIYDSKGVPRRVEYIGDTIGLANNFGGTDKYQKEPIFSGDIDNLMPIPHTPEILEKAGFVKSATMDIDEEIIYSIQVANNTSLYFNPSEGEWYLSYEWNNNHFKNDFWAKPKYLHQTQNLYFALTGEELNVTL